ncbi:MAG: hypothetical protein IM618_11240 [Cytophagales bacterium]|jgi:hypothetical protein|nr:hypothetical protein [Cytophagales bacterium]
MAAIKWTNRYSRTMEDDAMGRWARVAYAGDFSRPFYRGKNCYFEIAWIKKIKIKNSTKFLVKYNYPSSGKITFNDVKTAKTEVNRTFDWFVKMCVGNEIISFRRVNK